MPPPNTLHLLLQDVAVVNNEDFELDVSGVLAGIAPGDRGGIKVLGDAVNVLNCNIRGILIKYT